MQQPIPPRSIRNTRRVGHPPRSTAQRRVRRSLRTVAGTVTAALLAGLLVATPTPPAGNAAPAKWSIPRGSTYVALGDSTVTFNETRGYLERNRPLVECWLRYPGTYPKRLAHARGWKLVDGSCGGAQSKDYFRDQYKYVKRNARLVTLTYGGNDLRVFKAMDEAARSFGEATIYQASPKVQKKVEDRLVRIVLDIAKRAPRAKILLVGYLPLTHGKACPSVPTISPRESAAIKKKRDMIDRLLQRAGQRAAKQLPGRVRVMPLRGVQGHSACEPDEKRYISLLNMQEAWFHTNEAGHRYVARRIGKLVK